MGSHSPSYASATVLYPSLPNEELKRQFVGRSIKELPAPAAILDVAAVRRNCKLMLDSVQKLDVTWRAAIKTHKTTEVTKLQVGEAPLPVKLVASTVAEIENLFPWLMECKAAGREVNVLYGIPVTPSSIPRLELMARQLGEGVISLFVDHPEHVRMIDRIVTEDWPGKITVFVNIDVGYHREGIAPNSQQLADIATVLSASKKAHLSGMYTHFGSSYESSSPDEALAYLSAELEGLRDGAHAFLKATTGMTDSGDQEKLTLSVGATPTVTSAQNLLSSTPTPAQAKYKGILDSLKQDFIVELHAGVYPFLDLQQLATRARPLHSNTNPTQTLLDYPNIALRILLEISSVYPDRDASKPEALVAAGSIALGREPCKNYPGWGIVTPWPAPLSKASHYDPEGERRGWILSRISQEHGILGWEGPQGSGFRDLSVGEKIMVWPNHACITGVNYGWFAVVDSDTNDADVVRDVWVRWRGW